MKLWSESWTNGDRIPARCAALRPDGAGRAERSDNLNPHLAWSDVPPGAGSLLLLGHDFDVPVDLADADRDDRELPAEAERADFVLWLLADLPPRAGSIGEGAFSRGFVPRGKPGPELPPALAAAWPGARHGLNDCTRRWAADPALAGRYFGYDGPQPPWNDALVHHVVFTLYALDLPRLPLEGAFDGAAVRRAITGHVLGAATFSGTCTLNRRLLDAGF
jgi:phosphatidylethanolamine-binding protein (PEBP) family uncharacterized protein